jgi:branched-chain amino acid transport system permease protein
VDYVAHVLILIAIATIVAVSLDLVMGYTGLLSLSHGAFFGVGGYATALLVTRGVPALAAAATGMLLAAVLSMAVAFPSNRVTGTYLLITSLAVQLIFTVVVTNWEGLTGGAAGIRAIPGIAPFGTPLGRPGFLVLSVCVAALCFFVSWRLVGSPFGALLRAVRDDAVACQALGKNVVRVKTVIFGFAGALAALAGSLYAHYITYVDPRSFDLGVSTVSFLMVMVGGRGTLVGPVLGAMVLTLFPEIFKFISLPPGIAAGLRQLLYGLLLIVSIYFLPGGIIGVLRARRAGRRAVDAPPADAVGTNAIS